MSFFRQHPFPVEAFFDKSLVLGFAVSKEEVAGMIPQRLELDLFEDRWAFFAVALVRTRGLRLAGFPRWTGRDFTLIGYRLFVRYTNLEGRRLRGLYILGSETDRRSMEMLGGFFTSYRYRTAGIDWQNDGPREKVESSEGLCVEATTTEHDSALPEDSPFTSWREARRFAGPMPFTFSCSEDGNSVVIVEGVREEWNPQPMSVSQSEIPFLNRLRLRDVKLANSFLVENVPYRWEAGRIETWIR